jgi:PAS domain S-box-containing protein
MILDAFHTLGPALAEPAVLASVDGTVVAVNPMAADRVPLLAPGTTIGSLLADPAAWDRFVGEVRGGVRTRVTRLTLGPPLDAVWLVAGARVSGGEREPERVLLRVLHTAAPDGDTAGPESIGQLGGVVSGIDRVLASHARLEEILDQTSAMIYVKDADGRYVLVNREFERVLGRPRSEVLGRTATEVLGEESATLVGADDDVVLRTGEARTIYTTMPVDGVERSYATVKFLLPGTAGEPTQLAGIAMDITDRTRVEAALRVALGQLDASQRVGRLGSWETDIATGGVTASAVLAELFDVPVGSGLDAFRERYHPDDLAIPTALATRARAGEGRQTGRFRIVRPDGAVRWMETTVEVVAEDEGTPRLVGITQDVTEREEAARARDDLETRLRQALRLESVGQLAGGIAHDFNNILAVVVIQAELMLADREPDDPDVEDLRRIRDAAERAGGLTRQLLEFSRSDGGDTAVFDLRDVVDSVGSLLQRTVGEHIELVVAHAPGPRSAVADPTRIEQVVLNLAVNARDAMPDGGTLTIRTADQEVDESYAALHPGLTAGRYVMLAIADTGVGMDAETRQRAFDPFFTTKPKGRGTGLGLASVYGIVSAARGHVEIYSEPGMGTVVRVLLPAATTPGTVADAPVGAPGLGEGRRVLVVEDDEVVRTLVRGALDRAGYQVVAVSSSADALATLDGDGPPAVLVTDVVLTDQPGPQLADEVERRHPGVAVLFMSGYTDGRLAPHHLEGDHRAFIAKPFTVDALLRAVGGLATATGR